MGLDVPAAPDAAAHVSAGETLWLAGELDAAIVELDKAGGDPHARALLARLYSITGRAADARHTAARAVGRAELHAEIATDVSKIDRVDISRDGRYVATQERAEKYGVMPTVTVWSSLSGRALYSVPGDRVAFGRGRSGDMLVAIVAGNDGQVRVLDAETGEERWSHNIPRTWDAAVDTHDTLVTLTAPSSDIVRWNLSTGEPVGTFANDSNGSVMSLAADGTAVLSAETLLDLEHEAKLAVLPSATGESGIEDMRVSPDGQHIATSNKNQTVLVYNHSGAVEVRIPNAGSQLEFLDDNTIIATDGKHVTRWDPTGKQLADFMLPKDLVGVDRDRLVIGAGGHAVLRRGAELVMLQLTTKPTVVSRFGFAARTDSVVWSADGARLRIATTRGDNVTWSVAGGLTTAPKPATPPAKPTPAEPDPGLANLQVDTNRVFTRDDNDHVLHFFEALEPITAATGDATTVIAADSSGVLYVWNRDTAERLGTIPGTVPITALSLRNDGRTLAVARKTGGIELWDLPSRSHRLTLVAAANTWFVVTPSGRVDGERHGLDWGDLRFPGDSLGVVERGLAATVLAHPPAAIAIEATPPSELPARACIPDDLPVRPAGAHLAGNVFTFCFATDRSDPYCFALDVTRHAVAPVPAPLDVIAPSQPPPSESSRGAQIQQIDGGVEVCITPDSCRTITTDVEIALDAVSEDGTIAALAFDDDRMETWNMVTGKRIARFKVHYGSRDREESGRSLAFWDHNVIAISTPCAGPCGDGTVFSPRGKNLGSVTFEPSGMGSSHFHDDLWVLANSEAGFAIADSRTGDVIAEHDTPAFQLAMDSDHVAAVIQRGQVRRAVVYGRLGKLVARAKPPRCK